MAKNKPWKLSWIVTWSYTDGYDVNNCITCLDKWKVFEDLEEAREYYERVIVDDSTIREEEEIPTNMGNLNLASISAVVDSTDYDRCTRYQFAKALDAFKED